MINGLSMDTAYLLSQMCPFNLCNIDLRSYRGPLYTNGICFTLGVNPSANHGYIGVLFNFDLQSEADFDKSYATTTITTGLNTLCIISPAREKKHQLITEWSISGTFGSDNVDYGYGYMLKGKDLNASMQYAVNSPVGLDDYNPHHSSIGVLLETVDVKPVAVKWNYRSPQRAYSVDGKPIKEDCIDFRTIANTLISKQRAAKEGITV